MRVRARERDCRTVFDSFRLDMIKVSVGISQKPNTLAFF